MHQARSAHAGICVTPCSGQLQAGSLRRGESIGGLYEAYRGMVEGFFARSD